ncbi:AbrB/MazE/SpoVT family DNA-binding domain-containing protein [Halorubrum sp. DM2]|uniref:AbrB/MazE/SpoVT family DNA-binding domain-containing protein n=1 Tax=Halorubrum sp. DM2 TaxID=2527867 RepID=UPI0024B86D66|nr:AbrB/MazE/SpoVT family DNA-binding domain-containing protein [Halorubrum sp. DM2]
MSVETDSHGRLYLSSELRRKYGERFHVVGYEDRLELVPIDENPLEAIREAAGDAFEGESIAELRDGVREQAKRDAEAGFDRGRGAAEDGDA